MAKITCLFGLMIASVSPLMGFNISLSPNVASPQPLATSITWTANVSGDPDGAPVYEYRFSAEPVGRPVQVRRGFAHSNSWIWTPSAFEGIFTVGVTVKNVHAGTFSFASATFTLLPRLVDGHAAVNTTNHALVAFFSAPSCQVPNRMRVRFTPTSVPAGGIATSMATNLVPCRYDTTAALPDNTSMNFYIAGMYPSRTYMMAWEVVNPSNIAFNIGAPYPFTTPAIPAGVNLPVFTSVGASLDTQQPMVLHNSVGVPVNGQFYTSAATDLAGNVLLYYATAPVRTETGGNFWSFVPSSDPYIMGIREADLAGNTVLEISVGAVNEQLALMGKRPITSFHHEVRRITTPNGEAPGGYIMALAGTEQSTESGQGGSPGHPVDVIGDDVIVLDQNLNVKWAWDSFERLDINHTAVLDEKCAPGDGGCEPVSPPFTQANDWLHSNSAQYTPYDGNIVVSIRHQDVTIKINFANGGGDGHILWKLGNGTINGPGNAPIPSFTLATNNTIGTADIGYPWFSHQHDFEVELGGAVINGARIFTLFDNGNTRQASFNINANSRCQMYSLNEQTLKANLNFNGDLGVYSFAVGSAQLLTNGAYFCDAGFIGGQPAATTNPLTYSVEFTKPTGAAVHTLVAHQDTYRSFRMQDLYTAITP